MSFGGDRRRCDDSALGDVAVEEFGLECYIGMGCIACNSQEEWFVVCYGRVEEAVGLVCQNVGRILSNMTHWRFLVGLESTVLILVCERVKEKR